MQLHYIPVQRVSVAVHVARLVQKYIVDITLLGESRSHLIASVGDDNALTVSEIAIDSAATTGSTVITLLRQCSNVNAHSSSITGT